MNQSHMCQHAEISETVQNGKCAERFYKRLLLIDGYFYRSNILQKATFKVEYNTLLSFMSVSLCMISKSKKMGP